MTSSASVASPRPTVRFVRAVAAVVPAALVFSVVAVGFPSVAGATPAVPAPATTCSQSKAQLAAASEQAEQLAEKYNDARVARTRAQAEYVVADRKARTVQTRYAQVAADFSKLVTSEVQSAPTGQFALVFSSRSPKDFIARMALMDYVAGRRGKKVDQLATVRSAAQKAQAAVQARYTEQKKAEQSMATEWSQLKRRGATLQALQTRLCAQEQAVLAERATSAAARGPVSIGGAPSAAALKAVQVALAQRGDPYCAGCAGPDSFDCSGLTSYAWGAAGVSLSHSSSAQSGEGTPISRSQVQAGDLVFFYSPIHHVGIAINNTQMVHAPTYGEPVQIANIDDFPYVGAVRVG